MKKSLALFLVILSNFVFAQQVQEKSLLWEISGTDAHLAGEKGIINLLKKTGLHLETDFIANGQN